MILLAWNEAPTGVAHLSGVEACLSALSVQVLKPCVQQSSLSVSTTAEIVSVDSHQWSGRELCSSQAWSILHHFSNPRRIEYICAESLINWNTGLENCTALISERSGALDWCTQTRTKPAAKQKVKGPFKPTSIWTELLPFISFGAQSELSQFCHLHQAQLGFYHSLAVLYLLRHMV